LTLTLKEVTYTGPSKNLTERTFSGFIWMFLGSGIQVVLKIGVLAILARLVSPKEFGVMGIAIVIVEFSKMFAHMGVGPAIIQRKELEQRHLTTGFTLSIAMGVFFSSILLAVAPYLSTFFRMSELTQILRVIALIFLIDSLTLIAQALMLRNMKFKISTAIDVTSYLLGYATVGISLAYMGWGVWALVAANLSQAVLLAVLLVLVQPFPKKLGFEFNAFKELIFFGGGMTIAKVSNYLANQGDNLVIGRTLGAAALGIYGRAHQFMVMPAGLFGNALDKALFPAMAKVQDDKHRLAKAYLTGINIIALVAIPLSIIIILLAREIVLVLLGSAWTNVILPLQILACSLLFRMSYKMSDSLARATGAVYRRAWRQVMYAAVVLMGSYVGQFWGLYGVATGVAVALILNFLMMTHLSLQITGIYWSDIIKAHRHGMLLGAVTGMATYGMATICRIYIESNLLILVFTGVGALVPLLFMVIYFPQTIINEELKELFEMLILKRFKKPIPNHA